MQRFLFLVLGLSGIALASGCGNNQLSYAPVEGVVTIDGKPIAKAQVVLSCDNVTIDGALPTSRGATDDAGHFKLVSITPDKRVIDGAVVGEHRVSILTKLEDQNARGQTVVVRQELLDDGYTAGEKLTLSVPSGGNRDVRFDLESK